MKSQKMFQWIITVTVGLLLLVGCNSSTAPSGTPKYSEVVDTYPKGSVLCKTDASLIGLGNDGSLTLEGKYIDGKNGQILFKCYGTKITVRVPVRLEGVAYTSGTLLTIDKDHNWIQVSSWK